MVAFIQKYICFSSLSSYFGRCFCKCVGIHNLFVVVIKLFFSHVCLNSQVLSSLLLKVPRITRWSREFVFYRLHFSWFVCMNAEPQTADI